LRSTVRKSSGRTSSSPENGGDRAGPDYFLVNASNTFSMGLVASFRRFVSRLLGKKEYPVHETCAVCGERVYLPFHCEYCGKYYCDNHRLPFDHDCKNIGQWKKKGK